MVKINSKIKVGLPKRHGGVMRKVLVAVLSLLVCSEFAFADAFKILGSRALGMGGASVAVVGDSTGNSNAVTQYWNPAALGLHQGVSIDIPV